MGALVDCALGDRRQRSKVDDGSARPSASLEIKPGKRRRAFFDEWPAAAYISKVESWLEFPGGEIEFTMRRLQSDN
jgi:hypothetical protein